MQHDDIKLTSGAVLLAAILLAATDSNADPNIESVSSCAPINTISQNVFSPLQMRKRLNTANSGPNGKATMKRRNWDRSYL